MQVLNAVETPAEVTSESKLPWVQVCTPEPGAVRAPYFITETGQDWAPIGQNDAITWPELEGLFRRKNARPAEEYLDTLAPHGVTVLRLMLEYAQFDSRRFEMPVGVWRRDMVRLWDDLFAMCEERGLRILLTPFDTFWTWLRWSRHPYNSKNGGPCTDRSQFLLCTETRARIKDRLGYAAERWGGSGGLFAWDLWNEIHPSWARDSASCFADFISELSEHVRGMETRLYGRTHPQTVSMFGPHLVLDSRIPEAIFRHPLLDFASTHFYEEGTIDHPQNTVDAALAVGRLMRDALVETPPDRPFFDSESGPIHTFKDHHRTLPEAFDDEYFRHMQWAHLAGGGAGGGMRWPNRHPHSLTPGMRVAQHGLAKFLPLIDWRTFRRRNLNPEVRIHSANVKAVACGDDAQAVVWLIRTDTIGADGTLRKESDPVRTRLEIPGLTSGCYHVVAWDTAGGSEAARFTCSHRGPALDIDVPPFVADLALAITPEV